MSAPGWPPLVELRQYTLHPGRRDELIALFDATLIEPQERVEMRVCGQFRDLDDPDRFVWLRGYPSADADERGAALDAFYGGPTWATHAAAANATMIDSDDVFLLSPVSDDEPFAGVDEHPGFGSDVSKTLFEAVVWPLAAPPDGDLRQWIANDLRPELSRLASAPVAVFGSADAPNTFPALPVREGEPVLVWLVRFDDETSHGSYLERLQESRRWQTEVEPRLRGRLRAEPQRLRLAPTSRSRLR
ncbi:MAG TPA: NIPSNAP family protein [Nocardioidaceae bacterium]|nr:NIPSNAP family protein [Nocardioidaceae bacterium]